MTDLIYLAVPYSHPDPTVREVRFRAANKAAGAMVAAGLHVFSPISHTHPIALCCDLPLGFDYWEAFDRAILSRCTRLVILMVPGWSESTGVAGELVIAEELGLPVEYRAP